VARRVLERVDKPVELVQEDCRSGLRVSKPVWAWSVASRWRARLGHLREDRLGRQWTKASLSYLLIYASRSRGPAPAPVWVSQALSELGGHDGLPRPREVLPAAQFALIRGAITCHQFSAAPFSGVPVTLLRTGAVAAHLREGRPVVPAGRRTILSAIIVGIRS
jgi:hypothetical protein